MDLVSSNPRNALNKKKQYEVKTLKLLTDGPRRHTKTNKNSSLDWLRRPYIIFWVKTREKCDSVFSMTETGVSFVWIESLINLSTIEIELKNTTIPVQGNGVLECNILLKYNYVQHVFFFFYINYQKIEL